MSEMPQDFSVSVANWKGVRTVSSSVGEILGEANSLANSVIGNVNSVLEALATVGDAALNTAADAVAALGAFSPKAIAVSYSPPGLNNPGYLMPGPLTLTDSSTGLITPNTGEITVLIHDPGTPEIGGTPPESEPVVFGTAPTLQTFFAPPAPSIGTPNKVGAPPPVTIKPFTAAMPVPPALRPLVLPTFVPQPFPEYDIPVTQPLPEPPTGANISLGNLKQYVRLWDAQVIATMPSLGGVLVRDLVTQRDLRNSYESYRLRGCALDDDLEQAQIDYADEITRLMNQAESRQLLIDEGLTGAERERLALRFVTQYAVMMIDLAVAIAKVYFDAVVANAEAQLSLAKAMVAYYNGLLAQYAADADLYKLSIEEEVAKMKYWEALVHAEEAKTKANAQMTSLYVQTEKVEEIEADVYQSQVGALYAQVEGYRAQIEAIVAGAEVAKTAVAVYKGQTDAYAATVAAYKAHFDEYAAKTKAVAAQNQAAQSAAELSLAEASKVATEAMVISTNLEVAGEQLKAQASKFASSYESPKLTNTIEATKAQIAANSARIGAARYSTDKEVATIPNEAASNYAQQAKTYFAAASDAAYRASEQTLKAITSATQAAAIAQEAAGKSSAALSQGAYSALHVSAGLQGSGRVTGNESHTARIQQHVGDMLNYTESKNTIITA
jgi:hypothetical protein